MRCLNSTTWCERRVRSSSLHRYIVGPGAYGPVGSAGALCILAAVVVVVPLGLTASRTAYLLLLHCFKCLCSDDSIGDFLAALQGLQALDVAC